MVRHELEGSTDRAGLTPRVVVQAARVIWRVRLRTRPAAMSGSKGCLVVTMA